MAERSGGLLAGFRILDCTDELGVYGAGLLADLGADVIRVEPPQGDSMRAFPPFADSDPSVSLYYLHFNAGKRAITLDAGCEEGRNLLLRLVTTVDAVIESGATANLLSSRIGLDQLLTARPDLVLTSITPFGREGPYASYPVSDIIIAAQSGLLYLNGDPESEPFRPGGEQTFHMAGLVGSNATLLGLFHRQRTGEGRRLDVAANFATCLATLQSGNAQIYTWHKRVPARRGSGQGFLRALYKCRDGYVVFQALPGQWRNMIAFLKAHGATGDLDDPRYEEPAYRRDHGAHVNAEIERIMAEHEKQYLFETAQASGVTCMPVNLVSDIVEDPYLRGRGFFQDVRHPQLGREVATIGAPFRVNRQPPLPAAAAPFHGEHNREVWLDEVGLTAADLDGFVARGVI